MDHGNGLIVSRPQAYILKQWRSFATLRKIGRLRVVCRGGIEGYIVATQSLRRLYLECLHDQNKSGFFGGPAYIQPIRAI